MKRAVVALLVVTVALAGCVGSGGESGPASGNASETPDEGPIGNATDATDGTARAYPANASTRLVENGTYEPQQACNTGGCLTGEAWRSVDVTEMVPAGVPTVVTAEISYDTGNGVTPEAMEVYVGGSDIAYYRYAASESEGVDRVNVTLVRTGDGSVTANLFGSWPHAAQDPNVDYTLTVQARTLDGTVPAGVPVEVPVSGGQEVAASAADDGSVGFRVYGPDDGYQTTVTGDGQATFQADSDGAYVLVPTPSSSNLTLSGGADEPIRALTLSATVSEPTTYNGTGEETWTFERDGYPLLAGVYVTDVYGGTPLGFGPWTATAIEAGVTPPNGSETSAALLDCTPACFAIGGFGNVVTTSIAAPGLAPGSYEGRVASQAAVPFQYGHFTATYQR